MDKTIGLRVKDTITGFTGSVIGRVEYITGCNQLLVQPPVDDKGSFVDSRWVDENRCEVVDGERIVLREEAHPFGDMRKVGSDKPAPAI